jgi:cyclase
MGSVPFRVIARLDIKGERLVKGIQLEGIRALGSPEDFARIYYEELADELLFVDVVASLYSRSYIPQIIEQTAAEAFCPLGVAGGVRTLDDIRRVLRLGADKVCINTAAVRRPAFIDESVSQFGASTIVVSIEAKRREGGTWEVLTDSGRELTGFDAIEWACEATARGAGELLVTSVDNDGTGRGLDIDLVSQIAVRVSVPVIASGGIGGPDHVVAAITAGASAVAAASVLHYEVLQRERSAPASAASRLMPPSAVHPSTLSQLRSGLPPYTRAGSQ